MNHDATPQTSYKRNALLAHLADDDRNRLLKDSSLEYLELKRILFEPGEPLRWVYFPVSGVVSLVTSLSDGSLIEMAAVGDEGVVGIPMTFDPVNGSNARGVSQIEGESIRITANAFHDELHRSAHLTELVNRFSFALFTLVGQNAACNRLHNIDQRCARWLLMARDRVDTDTFLLTQEFLSQMLGTRRASVSESAAALHDAGAIRYSRGEITIVDRDLLEVMSCECYGVVQRAYTNLYATSDQRPATSDQRPATSDLARGTVSAKSDQLIV
jgi:CRP-like cAMP-binding protein